MEIHRAVHCKVMKGLGPEWTDKLITVYLDDINDGASELEIDELVRLDAAQQLRNGGFVKYIITEINNA